MCSWSLDMLSQPQESMELVYNKSKAVAVTGMAFPTGDVNNYVVGREEGTVYTASRHGSKARICEMFEGHYGPVTGLSYHNVVGPVDFSHLFVTSSFD
ncbi:cytoplasmic dynein 1 intermediate chain 1-like [Oncorhynchus tshawytscha]|uniref:cytoplasmic dynein 1 intermediate chain 1-like n=1 Tax=Oncorhynchus tshawytscha TaxID=74940 RepID=UPI001C3DFE79|nr:cytoplasmic dynein 1 intermediate chain 1-like [Oncorhynchus tshawytscha]